ncbi:hypothetical protein GOP47_0019192 [Adiantum capillus-veneris]|uniref:Uncharacterized protein n=1 Tax=Adiantum capillus-veneris TaxID=13818 RepID=A0A9D4UEM0_ADICA|nr:hypothetical protein GOP47_0019192 [Adiantum capillus-veneris]
MRDRQQNKSCSSIHLGFRLCELGRHLMASETMSARSALKYCKQVTRRPPCSLATMHSTCNALPVGLTSIPLARFATIPLSPAEDDTGSLCGLEAFYVYSTLNQTEAV